MNDRKRPMVASSCSGETSEGGPRPSLPVADRRLSYRPAADLQGRDRLIVDGRSWPGLTEHDLTCLGSKLRGKLTVVKPSAENGGRPSVGAATSPRADLSSRPGDFHPQALLGRVEDWRAGRQKEVFDRTTFPVPATSNAACGFPALRSPVCFTSRVIGPIPPGQLSAPVVERDSYCKASPPRTTTAYSTAPSRSLFVSVPASYGAGPSSLPSL
jgi:hypothetical protein